jgi:hypothetical protein
MPISCQVRQDQKAMASFKGLVRHHVDSYKANSRETVAICAFENGQGMWAKERFSIDPTSVSFDVEKTSSLVSPFVGTVTFTIIEKESNLRLTKAEAAVDTVFTHEDRSFHKHEFVYQEGQWKPTSRQHLYEGDWIDCGPPEADIFGCLEEFDGDK